MMMVRNARRKAVLTRWSPTGIGHLRRYLLEGRRKTPNHLGHRQDNAYRYGSALVRMVLAVTVETSPDQRRPLQSP